MPVSSGRRKACVVLFIELVRESDALVGAAGVDFSRMRQRLCRVAAFERAIATPTEGIPEWKTRESAEAWVRELREERRPGGSAVPTNT
jgi:hypothetical protein